MRRMLCQEVIKGENNGLEALEQQVKYFEMLEKRNKLVENQLHELQRKHVHRSRRWQNETDQLYDQVATAKRRWKTFRKISYVATNSHL
ncbi:hypothetical protein PsorP6_013838 [Peronosclerospora sorghi]|uniref:Uncharacterized protein n=1 Tax=Peronosclerospora sorghi TaxID=230839 RepID=A0ACC0VI30_9STRA|nr:hypothetical protein PsorP6_013838 [Peronosclerospora sorghi]